MYIYRGTRINMSASIYRGTSIYRGFNVRGPHATPHTLLSFGGTFCQRLVDRSTRLLSTRHNLL